MLQIVHPINPVSTPKKNSVMILQFAAFFHFILDDWLIKNILICTWNLKRVINK